MECVWFHDTRGAACIPVPVLPHNTAPQHLLPCTHTPYSLLCCITTGLGRPTCLHTLPVPATASACHATTCKPLPACSCYMPVLWPPAPPPPPTRAPPFLPLLHCFPVNACYHHCLTFTITLPVPASTAPATCAATPACPPPPASHPLATLPTPPPPAYQPLPAPGRTDGWARDMWWRWVTWAGVGGTDRAVPVTKKALTWNDDYSKAKKTFLPRGRELHTPACVGKNALTAAGHYPYWRLHEAPLRRDCRCAPRTRQPLAPPLRERRHCMVPAPPPAVDALPFCHYIWFCSLAWHSQGALAFFHAAHHHPRAAGCPGYASLRRLRWTLQYTLCLIRPHKHILHTHTPPPLTHTTWIWSGPHHCTTHAHAHTPPPTHHTLPTAHLPTHLTLPTATTTTHPHTRPDIVCLLYAFAYTLLQTTRSAGHFRCSGGPGDSTTYHPSPGC